MEQNLTDCTINSDNKSGLISISQTCNRHSIVINIQQKLHNTNNKYTLNWVKGHTGLAGNERADTLAKQAVADPDLPITFLPRPPSFIKYTQKQQILRNWQLRWRTSAVARFTKQFFPKISLDTFIFDRSLFLFLTNHGPYQQHKYFIKKANSPHCICGNTSTSLHYITTCPLTTEFHIKNPTDMPLNNWFSHILKTPALIQKIKQCTHHLETHEYLYENPLPF